MVLHNPHGATLRDRRKRTVFHRNLSDKSWPVPLSTFQGGQSGMTTLRTLEKQPSAMMTFPHRRLCVRARRAYAEQAFDHVRYGYFEEIDTVRRNQHWRAHRSSARRGHGGVNERP